jgi:hypothetical protein
MMNIKMKKGNMSLGYSLFVILMMALLMYPNVANAQKIMLEQNVNADTTVPKFGRNRANFVGSFISFGSILGQSEGDSATGLRSGRSTSLSYGQYYKKKFSNTYSVLFTISYRLSRFEMEVVGKQKYNRLIMNEVLGEFVNRFNFGKRGNFIGNYLEIGASADYAYNNKSKIKTIPDDPDLPYKHQKMILSNLTYLEKLNYSGHVRVGMNKFVLFADYRLSDLINDTRTFDLPPLIVGLRFDLGA